jgi:hypothetical protein
LDDFLVGQQDGNMEESHEELETSQPQDTQLEIATTSIQLAGKNSLLSSPSFSEVFIFSIVSLLLVYWLTFKSKLQLLQKDLQVLQRT